MLALLCCAASVSCTLWIDCLVSTPRSYLACNLAAGDLLAASEPSQNHYSPEVLSLLIGISDTSRSG